MVAPTLSLGESRAELGLGIVGFVTALVVIFSPSWSTFKTIVITKQVGATKPYSYSAVLFNSGAWVVFGIPVMIKLSHGHHTVTEWLGLPLMVANIIGVVVEAVYVGIFIRYAAPDSRRWPIVSLVFALGVPFVVLGILLGLGCSRTFVGYIAMFSGVTTYVIPVIGTYTAYKENDYTQISRDQAAASFVNGVVWTAYSCIGHVHAFVFVPNVVAIICAGGQLMVYCWLRYRVPPQDLESGDERRGAPSPPRDPEAGDVDVSDERRVASDGDDRSRVPGAVGDAVGAGDRRVSVGGAGGGGGGDGEVQMTGMQQHVADPEQQLAQVGGVAGATEDIEDVLAEVRSEVVVLGGGKSEDEVEKQVREKEGGAGHSNDDDDNGYDGGGFTVEKPAEAKAEGDKEIQE